ncbi:nucleotidyltransferase domain-containing protein [Geomonas sp. RF6]|uniref:type VII toxin-antitoxin system MntA family adenylyltransferase antitoxin n=1 Tax=Geomonas sp. RF6 TaxID=2897342 RepID=UPI001E351306|nr:nucleotidyltransferase domain-containing protein [Geomonas sp. RF6]UFS72696.1 nucleotidyltransferase domain-containing protein [Geomonas sp. RF6]
MSSEMSFKGEFGAAEIKATLKPIFEKAGERVVASYLYGSQATGKADATSDINVAVLLHPEAWEAGHDPRHEIHLECCKALDRKDVDLVVLNGTGDLLLLEEITNRGIVLHDHNPAFRAEFEAKVLHDFLDCRGHKVNTLWD